MVTSVMAKKVVTLPEGHTQSNPRSPFHSLYLSFCLIFSLSLKHTQTYCYVQGLYAHPAISDQKGPICTNGEQKNPTTMDWCYAWVKLMPQKSIKFDKRALHYRC